MKIGLDLDGVIIPHHNYQPRNERELYETPPIPGAFEGIKTLVEHFGASGVFIISACRRETEAVALRWLEQYDIYHHTGFARRGQIAFCLKGKDKAPLAVARGLGLFSDNKVENLDPMRNKVAKRCLFGPQTKEPDDAEIILTPTWEDLVRVALG